MAKVALLVGVSEYESGLSYLPGAVKDVDALCEVLLHKDMGGFAESDILLLKNPERQNVEMQIEALFSDRHKDDLVLFYFSGHGIKDDRGKLYLATRTTRKTTQGELIRATAVAANFIHDRMSESRSRRQVVILDSCFSGAFAEGLSAKDDGTVNIWEQLGGEGRVVLTSSSSTQYSFEEQEQDLSIYTRFLIEGIRTGEADRDEDEVISIDELHEYASQKVRELQPAMKPEIYAIREGFKIRLAKVPPGDPTKRYHKEVSRFIRRGEISFVGRRTLDVLRNRLELEVTKAKEIEDEVLKPYRKRFREKLKHYEQVFNELLERKGTISDEDRQDLQNLQQVLELRNEDTVPIEEQVTAQFITHQEILQAYKQSFSDALRQEYPLSKTTRIRLQEMQQQLKLSNEDIASIESEITAEVEFYHQKLHQYEQLFKKAIQQQYPLSKAKRNELQQQQQRLKLADIDIASIESEITAEVEFYHQKLHQYEQAFLGATKRRYHPNEQTRKQLNQKWQTLELREEDVKQIEDQISKDIETHHANLRQYEQEFTEAIQQMYPLNAKEHERLMLRREQLNLTNEDTEPIETNISLETKEYLQKLQQYEQVFRESLKFGYPLSDITREELRRFQKMLDLSDIAILSTEQQVIETFQYSRLNKSSLSNEQNLHITSSTTPLLISEEDKQLLQKDQQELLNSKTEKTNRIPSKKVENNLFSRNQLSSRESYKNMNNRLRYYLIILFFGIFLSIITFLFLPRVFEWQRAKSLVDRAKDLQAEGQYDQCFKIIKNARNYGFQDIAEEQNKLRKQCRIKMEVYPVSQ